MCHLIVTANYREFHSRHGAAQVRHLVPILLKVIPFNISIQCMLFIYWYVGDENFKILFLFHP